MQTVLQYLVHFLLAITGAVGVAMLWVGALALLCAGGIACTSWMGGSWFRRSRKASRKPRD